MLMLMVMNEDGPCDACVDGLKFDPTNPMLDACMRCVKCNV